jgi:sugar lactone lactonase YvrE
VPLAAIGALALGGAAAFWWWTYEPPPPPLDLSWRGSVIALAGDGVSGRRDGPAAHARFADPFGVAIDAAGQIFVTDAGETNAIRRLAPDGVVSTVAGGTVGFADGTGAEARFDSPSGLAIDARGTLYVADTGNNAIRRVTPDGRVTTLAGDGHPG